MPEELSSLLRRAATEPAEVPDASVLWRRGRRRRAGRALAVGATTVIVAVTAYAAVTSWLPQERRIPVHPVGTDRADARAITVIFHSLSRTGRYALDYRDVERSGDSWTAEFLTGPTERALEEFVDSRELFIEELEGNLRRETARLRRRPGSTSVRRTITRIRTELERLARELASARARLEQVRDSGGPGHVFITAEASGDFIEVTEASGAVDDELRDRVVGYRERIDDIAGRGQEVFDIRVERVGPTKYGFEARSFWVGPIPSVDRVVCHTEVRDRDGRVLYVDRGRTFPVDAPPTEDRRDGGGLGAGFTLDRAIPVAALEVTYPCRVVQPGHYVPVGETKIQGVGHAPHLTGSGGGAQLDPERHVVVESDLEWRGPKTDGETICIARVFGDDGTEIGAHGTTLYGSPSRRFPGERFVAIAVDVGDPDAANYATIECRATVPGVLFGPDQER